MFRLAHLSDVHLGPLPQVEFRQLVSKRLLGYVNWQRNRRRFLHDNVIDAILAGVKAVGVDHIAVTGDLVNLALDEEIELARDWLSLLGDPREVSVVPGNHDAYVPGALDRVCHVWSQWMAGDDDRPVDRDAFPYLRVRASVALIGVSTARATAPFMANGFFRADQARRLTQMLEETARRGLFRLVMIHHPPFRNAVSQHKRLIGIGSFQRVVRSAGAELVLHGHSHLPTLQWIAGRDGAVPLVGVAAAGQSSGGRKLAAQFNLVEIAGEPSNWRVQLTRHGFAGAALPTQIVETIDLAQSNPRTSA